MQWRRWSRNACWRATAWAFAVLVVVAVTLDSDTALAVDWSLIGWNNLGMHCMDDDFAVFSLLPPFNTIHAQLVSPDGRLVRDPAGAGITVTYEAIADPDGSLNRTSRDKTNFWDHVADLFGVSLSADQGLGGFAMPGSSDRPQAMRFDAAAGWFIAEGVPITPYDDAGGKNYYPLMHLVARSRDGTVLATTDIVLPVSDEMTCKGCHASDTRGGAMPPSGWVHDPDPIRDYRLNVLKLHDERQAGTPAFAAALTAAGYNPGGLYATVTADRRAVLCANCHLSEALPGSGKPGVQPLTQVVHTTHRRLDLIDSGRDACYRCHPGSATKCLRGAMGAAVAPDGTLAMQCQSCHGTMADVGAPTRTGWLNEPSCQNCHTGTATRNSGQIRFTSAFDRPGHLRVAADRTFATNPNTPALGLDLYRFSRGHGGLSCEACHGSTHAEFPSSHRNDNIQNVQQQGHAGMLVECVACHPTQPTTIDGGPHGMHPIGGAWIGRHGDVVESGGPTQCRACHGADYRGTVLSRSQADRLLNTEFGGRYFWRGFQIGCFTCHLGPDNDTANPNRPAAVTDVAATTPVDTPVSLALVATDPEGTALTLRIVSQPEHGTVGLSGTIATYSPDAGFSGPDAFTFAAWDGATDSNLGTGTVRVGDAPAATATPTPTSTRHASPPPTSTRQTTATPTSTSTPMQTSTRRASATITLSAAPGVTPTPNRTFARSPSATRTPTRTFTPTWTSTRRPTATPTARRPLAPTRTPTRVASDDD